MSILWLLVTASWKHFIDRLKQFSVLPWHFQNQVLNVLCVTDVVYSLLFSSFADEYKHILQAAGQLLAPLGLNFLKFSLSLRYYSPRVELFNKVSHDKGMEWH